MSGKMGHRATGRKPETVRRKSAKTDGAFGKETINQVKPGDQEHNEKSSVRRTVNARTSGA